MWNIFFIFNKTNLVDRVWFIFNRSRSTVGNQFHSSILCSTNEEAASSFLTKGVCLVEVGCGGTEGRCPLHSDPGPSSSAFSLSVPYPCRNFLRQSHVPFLRGSLVLVNSYYIWAQGHSAHWTSTHKVGFPLHRGRLVEEMGADSNRLREGHVILKE